MNLRKFLKFTARKSDYSDMFVTRPRIVCNDGFNISIQAGYGLYSTPRKDLMDGNYESVEAGYPSEEEPLLMDYAENPSIPTETVYGWVPVEVIEAVVKKHGGWEVEK